MKAIRFFNPGSRLLLTLALAAGLSACDNPVEDDDDHPVGLVLVSVQGQDVATFRVGQAVSGQITVAVNSTQTYTVVALSEGGSRLTLDGGELGLRIATQPQNATVALVGLNQLTVTGRTAGSGTLRLELLHEEHPEFAASIPVVVQ